MRTSFSRSLLSLETDRFRASLVGIAFGTVLLAAWMFWFFMARVAVYEVSGQARLEVGREPHALMSPVSGRVLRNLMALDDEVEEGDVLVELDADPVRFELEETRARAAGLVGQLESLHHEIEAERRALEDAKRAAGSAFDESRARHREAAEEASFADEEAERQRNLFEQGLVARSIWEAAVTRARKSASGEEALRRAIEKMENDRRFDISKEQAELSALAGRAAEVEATIKRLDSVEARLERDLSLHELRAPVSGRIGDLVSLRVGEVIDVQQHLGTVIPEGEVRVVAEFAPHRAIGRIRPGQGAKLRLQGFSWVQYGSVPATVRRVGSEPQNGTVRVELSLDDADAFPVSLSHGLPGTLEVEVERVSPAALVLRAAGDAVSRPVSFEPR